jgi:hypothetical protein
MVGNGQTGVAGGRSRFIASQQFQYLRKTPKLLSSTILSSGFSFLFVPTDRL